MEFDKKRIERLRVKLKKCYFYNYKNDKERLGYLSSELKSESNPFIQVLSTDLSERFSSLDKKGKEKKSGFSVYTLRDFFFNKDRLNYDTDAIPKLELYCLELEKEERLKNNFIAKDISYYIKLLQQRFNKLTKVQKFMLIGILIIVFSISIYSKKTNLPFQEIEIGNQIWSSEINIPITDEDSFCYGDVVHNCQSFGRLYTYKAAKKIADKFDGWELPISQDYENLINYLGEDKAMSRLVKGGDTGFNASLSGYKSAESLEGGMPLGYIDIGEETAFWTSSISEITDNTNENKPFALRLLKSGTIMTVCDCWTVRDALSLRLIKTNRGYVQDFIRNEITEEDRNEKIAYGNKIQIERLNVLNSIYDELSNELKKDYNNDKKRNLSEELIARIITTSESLGSYVFYKNNEFRYSSPERSNLFLTLLKSNLDKITLDKIFFNANFQGSDFSGLDLSNLNFAANLHGIVGSYKTELQGLVTPIKRIDFISSDFRGANLENTILYGNFIAANFSNTSFKNTSFVWSNLNSTRFTNSTFDNVSFQYSNLVLADFQKTKFVNGRGFTNCDLRNVKFNNSSFSGGEQPFVFENNFMSSKGTFFEYKLYSGPQEISVQGSPFIEESPLISEDTYYIYRDNNYYKNKPPLIKISDLDSSFTFFGSKKHEKSFFSLLRDKEAHQNKMQHYIVRTNDNINRSSKSLRLLIRFNEYSWDISKAKADTLYRKSSLGKLQIQYRGLTYDYKPKGSLIVASFKNCKFSYTHFKNSSLEYVSFKDSEFVNSREIGNYFINSKLYSNDFRINGGLFLFDEKTTYDDMLINHSFPLIKFINRKYDLLNDTTFIEHIIKKEEYKRNGVPYVNSYQDDTERKLKWVTSFEKNMELDSVEVNGKKNLFLRKKN